MNANTGEGSHLSPEERDAVLAFAVDKIGEQMPVLSSIHAANTAEATAAATRAAAAGAKGLLVFPHPAFAGGPLQPSLPVAYVSAIARASELPLMIYQTMPAFGMTFELDTLQRIVEVPGVVAIKEGTWDRDLYTAAAARFAGTASPTAVLADADTMLLDFLRMGADGATVASAVIDPDRYVGLYEARETAAAEELQRSLAPFARTVFGPPFRNFRARLKEALRLDGVIDSAYVRPPLQPLSPEERQDVAAALAASREPVPATS
jgi:4-hydroxy-tetrahydrodipicolinate synthase